VVRDAGIRTGLSLRKLRASQRALPGFLLIGAQKGGTTSLFHYLRQHPGFVEAYKKEINYFAAHYGEGERWYRAHFPLKATLDKLSAARGRPVMSGDATTWYIDHSFAPVRAAALVPDVPVVVLLRDPVRRAISHYHHNVAYGLETAQTCSDALAAEDVRLASEDGYEGPHHQHHSYRKRGIYADQMERWFSAYPREQVLVLGTHELGADPRATLDRVCDFVGLGPVDGSVDFTVHNSRRYPPQPEAIIAELKDFYAPHNARLFALLGREFPW